MLDRQETVADRDRPVVLWAAFAVLLLGCGSHGGAGSRGGGGQGGRPSGASEAGGDGASGADGSATAGDTSGLVDAAGDAAAESAVDVVFDASSDLAADLGSDASEACGAPVSYTPAPISDTDDRATPMPDMTAATGGVIASGTYFESGFLTYQGTTAYDAADTRQYVLVFDADHSTFVLANRKGAGAQFSGSYVTVGSTLTFTFDCPSGPAPEAFSYASGSGTLGLYDFTHDTIQVFTKL